MGYGGGFAARIVGGGVPDAPQWGQDFPLRTDFKWGRRAASPLAAVAVCGGGKRPGGINPSPTADPGARGYDKAAGRACPAPTERVL